MAIFKYLLVFFASLHVASGFKYAFLIIDVQNCFLEGGSVAVLDEYREVIPTINNILEDHRNNFSLVIFTQDWHCANHVSFASRHPGKKPYETIALMYNKQGELCNDTYPCDTEWYEVKQMLWPDHCVMNTASANLGSKLNIGDDDIIIRKGYKCDVDSYSAFTDNSGFGHTELHKVLQDNNITHVIIAGFTLEYSVYYTAKQAEALGYTPFVVQDASAGIELGDMDKALFDMDYRRISRLDYHDIEELISKGYHGSGSILRQNHFAILLQAFAVLSVGMMPYM